MVEPNRQNGLLLWLVIVGCENSVSNKESKVKLGPRNEVFGDKKRTNHLFWSKKGILSSP
jgi:hypothetical protein